MNENMNFLPSNSEENKNDSAIFKEEKDEEKHTSNIVSADSVDQKEKPKRRNKTQRKYDRYMQKLEKFRIKKEQNKEAKRLKISSETKELKDQNDTEQASADVANKANISSKEPYTGELKTGKRQFKQIQLNRLIDVYKVENFNNSLKICIDCSYSNHMSPKEQSRLAQQIGRCYAINKSLEKPIHLTLCNLQQDAKFYAELCRKNDGFSRYVLNLSAKSIEDYYHDNLANIGYLTPDADTYLDQLNMDTVYIIGGLVDETVAKKVTLTKCKKLNIKTFSLPIDKYMTRKQDSNTSYTYNKILTINQVFEILANYYTSNDWKTSLEKSVPKRKGFILFENIV